MKKKKVLVWETLATVSGGQKMTLTVMDMLSDQYDFFCLIPADGMLSDELKRRNIPYVLMGDQTLPKGIKGKSVLFLYAWMSVKNVCKSLSQIHRFKPDILYCPGPAALPWSAVCGSLTGNPVIWHMHHIFMDSATKKLLNHCGKWKCVRKIISVSNCVGEQITNKVAKNKVEVLYNPVDLNKYADGDAESIKSEVENILGRNITVNTLVVGHVALIQKPKKQLFTIKLVKGLRERGYDAIGVFAGECREPEYMDELEMQVRSDRLIEHVAFMGRRNDVQDLLNLVDILLIPSYEGFPLVGLEAAAARVPVAACNVAGAEEFIRVSGDGVCFKEDDVEDAVNAIEIIMKNKNEMVARGMAFAEKMSDVQYAKCLKHHFSI